MGYSRSQTAPTWRRKRAYAWVRRHCPNEDIRCTDIARTRQLPSRSSAERWVKRRRGNKAQDRPAIPRNSKKWAVAQWGQMRALIYLAQCIHLSVTIRFKRNLVGQRNNAIGGLHRGPAWASVTAARHPATLVRLPHVPGDEGG
jgi:hypothetical protein